MFNLKINVNQTWPEFCTLWLVILLWLAGIALTKSYVWLAVICPPYAWYNFVVKLLTTVGWLT